MQYHVVWVTKYRRKIQNPGMLSYLRKVMRRMDNMDRLCCVIQLRDRAARFVCFLVNTMSFRHT
ncbi:transposase [Vibrio campbellii]|uniref:transposase n=1 Tax=Vibrio campbellii TaxID=680 RepID=UPI001315477E